jgi:hypothetical protein
MKTYEHTLGVLMSLFFSTRTNCYFYTHNTTAPCLFLRLYVSLLSRMGPYLHYISLFGGHIQRCFDSYGKMGGYASRSWPKPTWKWRRLFPPSQSLCVVLCVVLSCHACLVLLCLVLSWIVSGLVSCLVLSCIMSVLHSSIFCLISRLTQQVFKYRNGSTKQR